MRTTLSLDDILRRGTVVCWAGLWAVVWAVLLGSFGLLWPGKSGKSSLISFLFLFFIYFQFSISFFEFKFEFNSACRCFLAILISIEL
jgi:hypothetical protein